MFKELYRKIFTEEEERQNKALSNAKTETEAEKEKATTKRYKNISSGSR